MICFIAMIVFGILGIFSATHRKIALEAFDCVFRHLTLRKCNTGLDVRLKSKITGKFLTKNPRLGKLVYKHFEIISWMFTILLIVSLVWTGISAYNYYEYGNCNGPSVEEQSEICIFDPTGSHSEISTCGNENLIDGEEIDTTPTLDGIDLSVFPKYSPKVPKDTLVYVGCYGCSNTKKVDPTVNQLVLENKQDVEFIFVHFPLYKEYEYVSLVENCLYEEDKVLFWKFHAELMKSSASFLRDEDSVFSLLNNIEEIDEELKKNIRSCTKSEESKLLLENQIKEIRKMNIEGTPVVFLNDQTFVGPKPLRVYEKQLSSYVDYFGIGLIALGVAFVLVILYFAIFKRDE